jgi:hypothetical protein
MEVAYLLAATVAVAFAAWLQRATSMPRAYVWLSRLGAVVFALLLVPTLWRSFDLVTVAQAMALTSLPLIAVPYQVRIMKFIERSKSSPAPSGARGRGGGRVRTRRRGRR